MKIGKNTRQYKEVLDRGCGGYWIHNTYYKDFDCEHGYEWSCEDCPIVLEINAHKLEPINEILTIRRCEDE